MPEITLVRHGQAKQNATSEADYDNLSELGRTQAKWVGEHFNKLNLSYDAIVTGTLNRQIDTQILMDIESKTPVIRDERFNEIRLYDLADLIKMQFGIDFPDSELSFKKHLNFTFEKWENGEILNPPETFENYKSRVSEGLDNIKDLGKNFTSNFWWHNCYGNQTYIKFKYRGAGKLPFGELQHRVTKLLYYDESFVISQMNALPHLETPDRWKNRTYT